MASSLFFRVSMVVVAIGITILVVFAVMSSSGRGATASIDAYSLVSTSGKPYISGTAAGTKTVQVAIFKKGSAERLYTSGEIAVVDGKWNVIVSEELPEGTYDVVVTNDTGDAFELPIGGTLVVRGEVEIPIVSPSSTTTAVAPIITPPPPPATPPPVVITPPPPVYIPPPIVIVPTTPAAATCPPGFTCTPAGATTTVVVTPPPVVATTTTTGATTLSVALLPLLQGGTAHAGTSVPISYLKVINTGTGSAHIRGFWVKQNGSAPALSVVGLTTVDDKGGSRGATVITPGTTPFSGSLAYAPTDAVMTPGQLKLFTIKAVLTSDVSPYLGTQLMIDVESVDTNAQAVTGNFPIPGTTWTISF